MLRVLIALLALGVAFAAAGTPTHNASAALFIVSSAADAGPGTLRQAILDANDEAAFPGADTITFDTAAMGTGTIGLASPLPDITTAITIDGAGEITLQPGVPGAHRIAVVAMTGTLTLDALTLRDGGDGGFGGALLFDGVLNITGSTFEDNSADSGGSIYGAGVLTVGSSTFSGNTAHINGGAIGLEAANATISGSTFSNNTATNNGGAIDNSAVSTVEISDSTFSDNTGSRGGAIHSIDSRLTIRGTTLRDNSAADGGAIALGDGVTVLTEGTDVRDNVAANGGGIYLEDSTFDLEDSSISDNIADENGGGILSIAGTVAVTGSTIEGNAALGEFPDGRGGGIVAVAGGTLTITSSTISGNSTLQRGGGIAALADGEPAAPAIAISDSEIGQNTAGDAGGGIYTTGALTISGTTIAGNEAATYGAGLAAEGLEEALISGTTVTGNSAASNVGIYNTGTMEIVDSTISDNEAAPGGAAGIGNVGRMTIEDSTLTGNAAETIAGAIANIRLDDDRPGTLDLVSVTISENTAGESGGAIANFGGAVSLTRVELLDNEAGTDGGAIFAEGGTLLVDASLVSGNTAAGRGGALHQIEAGAETVIVDTTIAGNTGDEGGGGLSTGGGSLLVDASTISGNSAGDGASGGGILAEGEDTVADVVNSTISGNSAGIGGGIAIDEAEAEITFATITDNTAEDGGGGIENAGTTSLVGSIVAGNTAGASNPDCRTNGGPMASLGYNLFVTGTDCPDGSNDVTVAAATITTDVLEPLADNGGPTATHALREDSAAIDAAATSACPDTDQRGTERPQDGDNSGEAVCDIGAFELVPGPVDPDPRGPFKAFAPFAAKDQ